MRQNFPLKFVVVQNLRKKVVSALKNIEHAVLSMVAYSTYRGNIAIFVILNLEEFPILHPLLIHDTSLKRYFETFTVKLCDTKKRLVGFPECNFER